MRVILRPGCSTASQNDGGGLGDSDVRPNNSNNNLVTSVTGEGGGGPPLPPRENDERSHCLENNDHVHDDPARSIGDEDDHEDEIHNLQYSVAAASSSSYSPGADSNRSSSPSKSAPPNATPVSSSSSSSYSYHFAYAPIRATHITAPTSSQNNQVSSSSSSSHQQHHPRQKKSLRRPRKTNIHNTIKTKTAVHPYPQQPSSDDPTKVPTLRDDEHTLRAFTKSLATRGLELAIQEGDGNCLFRAVSLQVYGDPGSHKEVRRKCLDFMQNNRSHFSAFITGESFDDYVRRKKVDGVHGNNPEIQALSELFNRPVEVFVPGNEDSPINIFQSEYKTDDIPIRLSYHDGNHYNAVIDPLVPTAGLGLGLPGLKPGEADRSQMQEAFRRSDEAQYDDMALREAVEQSRRSLRNGNRAGGSGHDYAFEKEKVLAMSDLEATEIELERAIMASSLEVYHRNQITMVSGRTGDLVSAGGIKRRRNIGNFAVSFLR
mmetsp:Transcript_21141/g.47934  ORF Transcript_21141/g.47934 Transcript_21141/m.47934 type:complete len:489 (-) Transcript_21141:704-2170(-)